MIGLPGGRIGQQNIQYLKSSPPKSPSPHSPADGGQILGGDGYGFGLVQGWNYRVILYGLTGWISCGAQRRQVDPRVRPRPPFRCRTAIPCALSVKASRIAYQQETRCIQNENASQSSFFGISFRRMFLNLPLLT